MPEKRQLVTLWVRRAWERFCSGRYDYMRGQAFLSTGAIQFVICAHAHPRLLVVDNPGQAQHSHTRAASHSHSSCRSLPPSPSCSRHLGQAQHSHTRPSSHSGDAHSLPRLLAVATLARHSICTPGLPVIQVVAHSHPHLLAVATLARQSIRTPGLPVIQAMLTPTLAFLQSATLRQPQQ